MDISMVDVDKDVDGLFDVELAAHRADMPDLPDPGPFAFGVGLRNPWPGREAHRRLVRVDGRIVAHGGIYLPMLDNLHTASLSVVVHPAYRRRGIGRSLLSDLLEIAKANGRRNVTAQTCVGHGAGPMRSEAGAKFLEAAGFTLALTDIHRQADITAMDLEAEARLYDEAMARSGSEYETVCWRGSMPDSLLDGIARINSTFFEEAPAGELELEAENIDAQHMRAVDEASRLRGNDQFGVVARHIASGELVANTMIGIPKEPGDHAEQWITIVSDGHRGHRLGMRVKVENLRQLRATRPEVRWIHTGNADVNEHMIAINEALGFRALDAWPEYQLDL